jgi:hypothetical protein
MKQFKLISTLCFCLVIWNIFALNIALCAEDVPKITLSPNCQTFYAGREHTLTITADKFTGERLSWNLRYAGRRLAAGERQIPANGEIKITFNFPKLNEGVIAEVEFSCFAGEKMEKDVKLNREIKKKLYFFHSNPFVGQKETFKKMNIGVWEAGDKEELSTLFKKLDLPFAKIADPANFTGEVLVVSGLDFDENPGISETLANLAETGKKVIILPPVSGSFANFAKESNALILRKNDIIKEFNKKFDSKNWNGTDSTEKSLRISQIDDTPSLKVVEKSGGFTFAEIRYKAAAYAGNKKKNYKIILTTWDIVKDAEVSPTPLYLLKNILTIITDKSKF